jgi:hypothetical protein
VCCCPLIHANAPAASHNLLQDFPRFACVASTVDLSFNRIRTVTVAGDGAANKMVTLSLANNRLSTFRMESAAVGVPAPPLTELHLGNNVLETLELTVLPALCTLVLCDNQSLTASGRLCRVWCLRKLTIHFQALPAHTMVPNLQRIDASNCGLSRLPSSYALLLVSRIVSSVGPGGRGKGEGWLCSLCDEKRNLPARIGGGEY